jgi:hypothetical protein
VFDLLLARRRWPTSDGSRANLSLDGFAVLPSSSFSVFNFYYLSFQLETLEEAHSIVEGVMEWIGDPDRLG